MFPSQSQPVTLSGKKVRRRSTSHRPLLIVHSTCRRLYCQKCSYVTSSLCLTLALTTIPAAVYAGEAASGSSTGASRSGDDKVEPKKSGAYPSTSRFCFLTHTAPAYYNDEEDSEDSSSSNSSSRSSDSDNSDSDDEQEYGDDAGTDEEMVNGEYGEQSDSE